MANDYELVRYIRNADSNVATGALNFPGDDRGDIAVGGVGYVTPLERQQASALGVQLDPISEEDARNLGLDVPDAPGEQAAAAEPNADLKGVSKSKLEEIAEAENVDLSEASNNEQRADAIRQARAAQPEGEASLPATAPAGGTPAVAPATTAGSGPGAAAGGSTTTGGTAAGGTSTGSGPA